MRHVVTLTCAAAAVATALFLVSLPPVAERVHAASEVRALWVVRTTLVSPSAVQAMVESARAGGFNTLLVQVRGRGDAYFRNGLEPLAQPLVGQEGFDPLAMTIELAHAAGLQVHAWINVNLVMGDGELPPSREHIVYRHPEWLMVPQALAADLNEVDVRSPAYLGRLARYARSRSDTIEGLYLSPIPQASVDYTASVVKDIVERYPVDGVHFDYLRYPNENFDYGREALAAFRADVSQDLEPQDQLQYDNRLAADPLVYTRAFPERWHTFRSTRLTELLLRLRDTVKTARPNAVVSAAVAPDPVEAAEHRLQDWSGWLARNLLDVVCPMAYTTDPATFAAQVRAARVVAGNRVWAGIGAYRLSAAEVLESVAEARQLGVDGIALFSYDSLTDPARGPGFLAELGRAAFADQ